MKFLLILAAMLSLTACTTTTRVVKTVFVPYPIVIKAPETLFTCPTVEELPNPDTLTNQQLIDLIVELMENNHTCKINIQAIWSYNQRATLAVDSVLVKEENGF